jgi:antitoxin Phd
MLTNTNNLVSITDANQNFSKVAKKVDENGKVIILKNNKPQYILSKFDEDSLLTQNEMIITLAHLILTEHIDAFKELAK